MVSTANADFLKIGYKSRLRAMLSALIKKVLNMLKSGLKTRFSCKENIVKKLSFFLILNRFILKKKWRLVFSRRIIYEKKKVLFSATCPRKRFRVDLTHWLVFKNQNVSFQNSIDSQVNIFNCEIKFICTRVIRV